MVYRSTDTIHDKLYVPLHLSNSAESKKAFLQIEKTLPSMSIMGFLGREIGKARVTLDSTDMDFAPTALTITDPLAPTAPTASTTPTAPTASTSPASPTASRPSRRFSKTLKDSNDEYDSDGSYMDDADSEEDVPRGNRKRPVLAISRLDDLPTTDGYFALTTPVPATYPSKSSDAPLAAFNSINNAISRTLSNELTRSLVLTKISI